MKTNPPARHSWPIYGAGLLTCAAISVAAWLLAIAPALDQLHQRAHRLQELAEKRQKLSKTTASLASLRNKQTSTVRAINELDLRLEPSSSANARMAAITRIANDCGLTVDEVRPGQTTPLPRYQTVSLTLSGSGPYPAVVRLLHRMHLEMRDTSVDSLDLSPDNGNVANPAVRFRLDFRWYAAPASAKPTPAPVATTE